MKTALETRISKPRIPVRKSAPAVAKKPRKKPTDIDRMRSVARRLLKKLESEIKQTLPDNEEEISAREKKYHLMFGSRSTYLSTLNSLADVLIKLEAGHAKSSPPEPPPPDDIPMSPADVALVEHFVNRMKKSD